MALRYQYRFLEQNVLRELRRDVDTLSCTWEDNALLLREINRLDPIHGIYLRFVPPYRYTTFIVASTFTGKKGWDVRTGPESYWTDPLGLNTFLESVYGSRLASLFPDAEAIETRSWEECAWGLLSQSLDYYSNFANFESLQYCNHYREAFFRVQEEGSPLLDAFVDCSEVLSKVHETSLTLHKFQVQWGSKQRPFWFLAPSALTILEKDLHATLASSSPGELWSSFYHRLSATQVLGCL